MKYDIATANRLGDRKENQDRIGVVETPSTLVMVVADGMGGLSGGKLAAETFVNSIIRSTNNAGLPLQDPLVFLEQVIKIGHYDVLAAGRRQHPPIEPGTTCVICVLQGGCAWWAHVGDSRLYHLRRGHILSRTKDHSQVEKLVREGRIRPQDRHHHPEQNIITRCIGCGVTLPEPSFSRQTVLEPEDILLLCTDGLWGALIESQLGDALCSSRLDTDLNALAQHAESESYPKSDNISAIALRWEFNAANTLASFVHLETDGEQLEDLSEGLKAINRVVGNLNDKY